MSSAPITTDRTSGNNYHERSPRKRIETLMYVGLGLENGGFPINVSEGGMSFQGIRSLEKDQLLHINFQLPGLSKSVESAAQIAWLNDLGKGGGLRFVDLPEGTRQLINEWVSVQASSCDLAENTPILRKKGETRNFQSAPAIQFVTNQDHSSAKADSSAVETLLDSSLSPVATSHVITTSETLAIPIHSVNSARDSGFRDPSLESEWLKAWSKPFSRGLIMSLAMAAILGVISFQFHGDLQLPATGGNPAQPVSKIETLGDSEKLAIPGPKASVSRPAKKAMPLKIRPPKTFSRRMGTNAKHVTPSPNEKSPAADITPPALTLPANPALSAQLPALLLEIRPPAPSPREPVQNRSSNFDPAQLIAQKNPVYPKLARAIGLSGSVELHFMIGADGNIRDVSVVKGNPLLAGAAVEAIKTWHYQPARRDGVSVETESSTVFVFKPH